MVTQKQIAKAVGLDCSSVNKILNKTPYAVFRRKTVNHVLRVARRMGYDLKRPTKAALQAILLELFPESWLDSDLAEIRRVPIEKVKEIRRLLYKRSR